MRLTRQIQTPTTTTLITELPRTLTTGTTIAVDLLEDLGMPSVPDWSQLHLGLMAVARSAFRRLSVVFGD
jgi:hypothetical protein